MICEEMFFVLVTVKRLTDGWLLMQLRLAVLSLHIFFSCWVNDN